MWITTATIDLVAVRSAEDINVNITLLKEKRLELQKLDGYGFSIPGWEGLDDSFNTPPELETLVVKRAWSKEENAQAFVDFLNSFFTKNFGSDVITVSVEYQS